MPGSTLGDETYLKSQSIKVALPTEVISAVILLLTCVCIMLQIQMSFSIIVISLTFCNLSIFVSTVAQNALTQ